MLATVRYCAMICWIAPLVTTLRGQIVSGKITLGPTQSAYSAALITVTDSTGLEVARTNARAGGNYSIVLPGAGRFQLRALRVGFEPTSGPSFSIGIGEARVIDLHLSEQPVRLSAVQAVADGSACSVRRDGDAALKLWEQARGALELAADREALSKLRLVFLMLTGTEERDGRHAVVDSVLAREVASARAFATTPEETLAAGGYVRPLGDGRLVFDAPSADVLLSPRFAEEHCFAVIKRHPADSNWIGLSFSPLAERDSFADISGTLWVNKVTAELRRLEFAYTNLRYYVADICARAARGEGCGAGPGGYIDFGKTSDGAWLVQAWKIRTPAETVVFRDSRNRARVTRQGLEPCTHGRECGTVLIPLAQLSTNMGSLASGHRDGRLVFRDDRTVEAMRRIAVLQAGGASGGIRGYVSDEAGHSLVGAIVQTQEPFRVVSTDTTGHFVLDLLPARSLRASVRHEGFRSVGFQIEILKDSTRQIQLRLERAP
jgi:hypothetical protein